MTELRRLGYTVTEYRIMGRSVLEITGSAETGKCPS